MFCHDISFWGIPIGAPAIWHSTRRNRLEGGSIIERLICTSILL